MFLRIILFLQEYIYYLQEGDEICYNIFSTPLKKENKKKMFIFQLSFILFTMSIVIFTKHEMFTDFNFLVFGFLQKIVNNEKQFVSFYLCLGLNK